MDTPLVYAGRLLLIPLLCLATAGKVLAANCPAERTSERVRVVHVYDGDTIKLVDGRRLRLIGINAPEIRDDASRSQALAEKARSALRMLLDRYNRTLNLQYGRQNRDHYGRLLAHAFLDDGTNVAVRLLQQGMATALVVPPNTWGHDCYASVEAAARAEQRGLWALPDYQTIEGSVLHVSTRGFRIVLGRIIDIRTSRHGTWLELEGPLAIRVDRKDLVNFPPGFPETLDGKTIEVRGWIKAGQDGLMMNVRHPAALVAITAGKAAGPGQNRE
jgi:endonuclease YncB( thermonuclease family)